MPTNGHASRRMSLPLWPDLALIIKSHICCGQVCRNLLRRTNARFYILLTVHHVMILGKWPTWRTLLYYVLIFVFNSLHVSSTSCSSSGETNCVNTTSDNCHSVSVAVSCEGPTCTRHGYRQLPEVVLTQFVSPDDEHDVLETCRELKIKISS